MELAQSRHQNREGGVDPARVAGGVDLLVAMQVGGGFFEPLPRGVKFGPGGGAQRAVVDDDERAASVSGGRRRGGRLGRVKAASAFALRGGSDLGHAGGYQMRRRRLREPEVRRRSELGRVVAEGALVGGEAGVLGGVEQGVEEEPDGVGATAGRLEREGEKGVEFAMIGKLQAGALEGLDGAGGLADEPETIGQTDQGVALFVGRETEGEGAFIVGEGVGGAIEDVERPSELVGDLGNVRMARIQVANTREKRGGLAAVAGADDGVECGFPIGSRGHRELSRNGKRGERARRFSGWLILGYRSWRG